MSFLVQGDDAGYGNRSTFNMHRICSGHPSLWVQSHLHLHSHRVANLAAQGMHTSSAVPP